MAGDGIRIDASEFSRLMREAKDFDRQLATRLRKSIRDAAKQTVLPDVRQTVLQPPPGDAPGTVGTRAAIASGLSVRIGTGAKGGNVTIAASSKNLPQSRKPMLRLYNKPNGWRHPVFGNKDARWMTQQGRPYFGSVILQHQEDLKRVVLRAMDEAAEALARKV